MYCNKKYQDFIDDNFFVIDSNNCKNIESKLYGFVIEDNKFVSFKKKFNQHIDKKENGVYVNIIKENEKIIIEQDAIGSYGLFLYQRNDYFALSNSFFYLFLYLKQNNILSLSLDTAYINYFMNQSLTSLSIERTPIKEIKQIDKDIQIIIDTNEATIDFVRDKLPKHIYPLDSKESFEILDKWFSKYCSLIHFLYKHNFNFQTGLSGGRDSRLVLTLFNHLDLLQKINIYSSTNLTAREQEDFKIANQIAQQYNFQLNHSGSSPSKIRIAPELSLFLTFCMMLGLHKELFFKINYFIKPYFAFNGLAGENLRNAFKGSEMDFIEKHTNKLEKYTGISNNYQFEIFKESFNYLKKITHHNIGIELYNYARLKMHAGKNLANDLLGNTFAISPLNDPILQFLNTNDEKHDDLLISIIYQRYMPGVINIPFTDNQINDSVKTQADEIQKKYPKHIEIKDDFIFDFGDRIIPEEEKSFVTPQNILSTFFQSKEVKNFSSFFFNDKLYSYCEEQANNSKMYQNNVNANTLSSFCILTKILFSDKLNIYSYITSKFSLPHSIHKSWKQNKTKTVFLIFKVYSYNLLIFLVQLPLLKSLFSSSALEKLEDKQQKYLDKLLFGIK